MKIILSANKNKELREELSALEHDQWIYWTKGIAKEEDISKERLERWEKEYIDYEKLSEKTKDFDREWADKVLKIINKFMELK